jgi:hypothetical protein
MMIGFDVHHPSKGSSHPSTATLCASMDGTFARFFAKVLTVEARQELEVPFGSELKELFAQFRAFNKNAPPPAVVVFRDGVGDTQIASVIKHEVPIVREVFGTEMPLLFVLVKKRHHIRLVCRNCM